MPGLLDFNAPGLLGNHGMARALADLGQPQQPSPMARSLLNLGRQQPDPLFGFVVRDNLFPGEQSYFKANPNVSGMAAETNDIILNPFSSPEVNRDAVARNEAMRLLLRQRAMTPAFSVSDEQKSSFAGTPYADNETALRETIAARIYSGDPSARATPEQRRWLSEFLSRK